MSAQNWYQDQLTNKTFCLPLDLYSFGEIKEGFVLVPKGKYSRIESR